MSNPLRVMCIVTLLLAAMVLAVPASAGVGWLTRPGTISNAIEQPDGTSVYLDVVTVAKLKGNQNPAYFVIRESWATSSLLIVAAAPADVLRLGQDIDVVGMMGTLPNGMRAILNPQVIGYYDQSGNLLKNCPHVKSITGVTPWAWKSEIALPTTAPSGDYVPGEPNLDLPAAPVFHSSIASLLADTNSSAAKLDCKRIVGGGIDPIYGAYMVLGDDFAPFTVKVFGSGFVAGQSNSNSGSGASAQSLSARAASTDETAPSVNDRVNEVTGQVHTVGGETVLVLNDGPIFDTENYSGSMQTVNSGTIAYAKSLANGMTVTIPDVTVIDNDPIAKVAYVEDVASCSGIKISYTGSSAAQCGNTVSVTGTLSINADGERELIAGDGAIVVTSPSMTTVKPWGMNNCDLGGAAFNELTPGINNPPAVAPPAKRYRWMSTGLYNKGLLVKIWGRVTAVNQAAGYFYINDGSDITNGSDKPVGVKVVWNSEGGIASLPMEGEFIPGLVGISSSVVVGPGDYARMLRLRYLSKLAITGSALSKSITLNWTAAPDTTYSVARSMSEAGPFNQIGTTDTGSFTDTELTNGTAYYYRVTAAQFGTVTAASDTLTLTPTGAAPTVTCEFNSATYTYTYTVTNPANAEFDLSRFEVQTFAPNADWSASGTYVGGTDMAWLFASQVWDAATGNGLAMWNAMEEQVIPANTAAVLQFKLVVPNSEPVAGNVVIGGSDLASTKTFPVMVPTKLVVAVVQYPPTTTINLFGTTGSNGWYVSPVSVDMLAMDPDEDLANTYFKLDDLTAAWTTFDSAFDVSADGEHIVQAYSDDLAGNKEDPAVESTFKIDATAPAITGQPTTQPNAAGWYKSNVVVNWTMVDATSGLATPYTANPATPVTFGSLLSAEDANVTASQTAIDVAGNTSSKAISLKIDKTKPTLSVVSAPMGNNHVISFDQAVIRFTAKDAISGLDGAPMVAVAINPAISANCQRNFSNWGVGCVTRAAWLREWMRHDDENPANRTGWNPFVVQWLQNWISHNYDETMCTDDWSGFVANWLYDRTFATQIDQTAWNMPTVQMFTAVAVGNDTYEITFPIEIPGTYSVKLYAKDKAGNDVETVCPITFTAGGFTVDWMAPLSTMETYTMEDGSTIPVKFRLLDPAGINSYVDNCLYTVKVIDTAAKVWKQVQIPDVDMMMCNYKVDVKTQDANGVDWPAGDYTITIEGPGIWDVLSGPYKSSYGVDIIAKAVAKGKGKR